MTGIDWIVIGVYFVLLAGVVIGSSRQQQTSADYFWRDVMSDGLPLGVRCLLRILVLSILSA